MQDIYGFLIFNALYTTCTWDFESYGGKASFTAGWAVDWWDKHRGTVDEDSNYEVNHVLEGPFIGIEQPVRKWVSLIAEYDTHALNAGLRLRPTTWITIDVAAARWGLDKIRNWELAGFAAHLHMDGNL